MGATGGLKNLLLSSRYLVIAVIKLYHPQLQQRAALQTTHQYLQIQEGKMAVTSVLKFLLLLSCVALIAILKPCHHVQHSPGISPITNRSSQVQHGEMAAIGISKDLLQLSCDPRLTVFTASLPQLQDSCVSTPNAHRPLQVQEGETDDLNHAPIKDVSKEFYPLARDTVETAR